MNKGSEFYNRSLKSFLQNDNIEMDSMHNEGKSVVFERFNKTLKKKIYKCMTSISKNVCTDKLDYIVNKYNNTYHKPIKMKPVKIKHIYMLLMILKAKKLLECFTKKNCKKNNKINKKSLELKK